MVGAAEAVAGHEAEDSAPSSLPPPVPQKRAGRDLAAYLQHPREVVQPLKALELVHALHRHLRRAKAPVQEGCCGHCSASAFTAITGPFGLTEVSTQQRSQSSIQS